jgi:cell pole-organizing protein PopZ
MWMAKPNEITESSMEEILASIRKIISEDESRTIASNPAAGPMPADEAAANNVSRLFGEDRSELQRRMENSERDILDELLEVEAAASEKAPVVDSDEPEEARTEAPPPVANARSPQTVRPDTLPATAPGGSLLSPHADAAVTSAFNHLATTMLANNARSVEQLAEEMMRPMLKDWLDENMPPMVERLVREEIERVSRRR